MPLHRAETSVKRLPEQRELEELSVLEKIFNTVYTKFKMNFYKKIFNRFETREASLTAVETICVEVIHALGHPTVNEFAQFVNISQPNATHKIKNLMQKGYLVKEQSADDRREYTLSVTDKFFRYYNLSHAYIEAVAKRMTKRFTPDEQQTLLRFLNIIDKELMPEIQLGEYFE